MASATSRVTGGATRGRRLTRPGLRAGPLFTRACTLLMSPTIASATTGKAFGVRVGARVGRAEHWHYPHLLLLVIPLVICC